MQVLINVLQINGGSEVLGGVSMITARWYRHIDKSTFRFTFLSYNETTYEVFRDEIENHGGTIVALNAKSKLYVQYAYRLYKYIKNNRYDIVHVSSGLRFFNFISLFVCKLAGIKVRIVHSRNAPIVTNRISGFFLKLLIKNIATHYFSISKNASVYMFTRGLIKSNKIEIIKNGIVPDEFTYNNEKRERIRLEMELGENFTIGHIGRFTKQKNHRFLLDIFRELLTLHPHSILLLVGEGELESEIRKQAENYGIINRIKFLGTRKDIPSLLNAMDVFVFPSLFEGFGNVGLEAQACGLPTFMSDNFPKEISVTENSYFVSLDRSAKEWAENIFLFISHERKDLRHCIVEAGFDMRNVVKQLECNYLSYYYEAMNKKHRG